MGPTRKYMGPQERPWFLTVARIRPAIYTLMGSGIMRLCGGLYGGIRGSY